MVTLSRVLAGWSLGAIAGITVGLLMTSNRVWFSITNPFIEGLRPIPPIALVPFFILWFGLGSFGQILLIALGCFMVMAVNTVVAVNNLAPIYIRAARTLGATRLRVYLTVVVPGILPALVAGLRIAAALAFGLAVAAEFMGAQSGIGFLMMVARRTLNTNTILLGTIILGMESFAVDAVIRKVCGHFTRWNESSSEALTTFAPGFWKEEEL